MNNCEHTRFSWGLIGFVLGGAAMAAGMLAMHTSPPPTQEQMNWPASAAFDAVQPDEIAAKLLPPEAERTSPEAWVRADDQAGLHVKYAAFVAHGPSIRDKLIVPLTKSLETNPSSVEPAEIAAIERAVPTIVASAGAIAGTRDSMRQVIQDGVYCRCAVPYSIGASSGLVQSVLVAVNDSAYLVVTVREYPSHFDPDGKTESSAADRPLATRAPDSAPSS